MKDKKESSNEPTPNESQVPQTSQSPQDQQDHQAPQVPSAPVVTENGTTATPPETGAPDSDETNVLKNQSGDIVDGATEVPGETPEQIEFTKKVLPSEKIYYENIISAQKKTIASLRSENIKLHSELKEKK